MLAASLDNAIDDHMDTIRWSDRLPTRTCSSLGIVRLSGPIWDRANRGTGSLSPRAYRAQSTIAELAVWEIGPSTSVRAPRTMLASPGRETTCERWQDRSVAQMFTIPSRTTLLLVLFNYVMTLERHMPNPTASTILLVTSGRERSPDPGPQFQGRPFALPCCDPARGLPGGCGPR